MKRTGEKQCPVGAGYILLGYFLLHPSDVGVQAPRKQMAEFAWAVYDKRQVKGGL